MRLPQSWDDLRLLQDQPLCHWFDRRSHINQRHSRHNQERWENALADELRNAKSAIGAIGRWVVIAFQPINDGERNTATPPDFSSCCLLFARVYWRLYRQETSEAYWLIRQARQQRGYWYDLPNMNGNGDSQETVSNAASSNAGMKRRRKAKRGTSRASPAANKGEEAIVDYGNDVPILPSSNDLVLAKTRPIQPRDAILGESQDSADKEVDGNGWDTDSTLSSLTSLEEDSDEPLAKRRPTTKLTQTPVESRMPRPKRLATNHAKIAQLAAMEAKYFRNGGREQDFNPAGNVSLPVGTPKPIGKKRQRPRRAEPAASRQTVYNTLSRKAKFPGGRGAVNTSLVDQIQNTHAVSIHGRKLRSTHQQVKEDAVKEPRFNKKASKVRDKKLISAKRRSTHLSTEDSVARERPGSVSEAQVLRATEAPVPSEDISDDPKRAKSQRRSVRLEQNMISSGLPDGVMGTSSTSITGSAAASASSGMAMVISLEQSRATVKPNLTCKSATTGPRARRSIYNVRQSKESSLAPADNAIRAVVKIKRKKVTAEAQAEQSIPVPSKSTHDQARLSSSSSSMHILRIQNRIERPVVPSHSRACLVSPPIQNLLQLATGTVAETSQALSVRHAPHTTTLSAGLAPSHETSRPTISPHEAPPRQIRPQLPCVPPVWAKHRQEVCETVEWFRSYQGGVYFNRGGAHGYLLSAFSAKRDLFHHQGKLIISHGGGKAEAVHSREGKFITAHASDQQADDKSVRALLSSYEQKRPIVLLIDDKYELFPYDLNATHPDYTYVALGNYLITRVWAERSTPKNSLELVVRYKFAFQWCDQQGEPWWIENTRNDIVPEQLHGQAPDNLQHSMASLDIVPVATLTAETRQDCNQDTLLTLDMVAEKVTALFDYESAGITVRSCQFCSKPSPLVYQDGWMCVNPGCMAFWLFEGGAAPPELLTYADSFLALLALPYTQCTDIRPLLPADSGSDEVKTGTEFTRGFHCDSCGRLSCRTKWQHWDCSNCYKIYGTAGRTRLPNELWRKLKLGFDRHKVDVTAGIIKLPFSQYKENNLYGSFQTFVLPGGRGRIHHILGNPLLNKKANIIFKKYQEQAADGRISFRRWPIRMHKCRGDLLAQYFSHNAGAPYHYVGGTNETVSFEEAPTAVMEALSLIQDRAAKVLEKHLTFNEILSAAYMQDQQMAYHGDDEEGLGPVVASLSLGSPALMRFRPKHGKQEILSIILHHGDVLVMEGLEVQQFYEHQVQPVDFRIAATARMIGPLEN